MLSFVGLGLYDERSVTVAGRDAIRDADRVFAEFYTSLLAGATVEDLEDYHGVAIELRDRDGVEADPGPVLEAADGGEAAFLTAGDTMISTTHADLRLRAHERGVDTRIVHAPTAQSAAASLTGLQNYRFGAATTLPFPDAHTGDVPDSVLDTLADNRERGLHTLVYLDIRAGEGRYMAASTAAGLLAGSLENTLAVAVARAGSPDPVVRGARLAALADGTFGDPPHLLVVPGDLHHVESETLRTFADAPAEVVAERTV